MKYLSVCSGIEAASVAWKPLGWEPVAFAEIEPFPCAVLAHHYPEVPNLGDITRFKEWPDLAIDLLVGGTPCQSFSVAGLRGGLADPRGNLALVYLAIADRYRPKWIVFENVPGLLSSNGGRDFGSFLGALGQLGYGFAYRVLDAQFCRTHGFERAVPQRRRRVFVVGYLGDWRRAAAVFLERESLQGNPAPRRKAGEKPAPTISARTKGGGGLGTDFDCDGGLIAFDGQNLACAEHVSATLDSGAAHSNRGMHVAFGGNRQSGPLDVATAVNAHGGPHGRLDFESETFIATTLRARDGSKGVDSDCTDTLVVAHSLRADGFDASEDGTGRGTPLVPVAFSCKDHGADAGETSPTIRAMGHAGSHANAGGQVAVAFHENSRAELRTTEVASSLKVGGGKPGQSYPATMIGSAVRRLTPVECSRLQGFPDDYLSQVMYRGKPPADGPMYKALGNSMACNVVRWIGYRIQQVEALSQFSEAAE